MKRSELTYQRREVLTPRNLLTALERFGLQNPLLARGQLMGKLVFSGGRTNNPRTVLLLLLSERARPPPHPLFPFRPVIHRLVCSRASLH